MKRWLTLLVLPLAALLLSAGDARADALNALTSVFYIAPGGSCAAVACASATRRMCRDSATSPNIYACNTSTGFYVAVASIGGAAGSNQQVQINSSGSLAGDSGLTFDPAADVLTVGGGVRTNSSQSSTIDTPVSTTWNSTTSPATSTLTGTLPILAQAKIDYTMADATAAPVFVSEAGGVGAACTQAETFYKLRAVYSSGAGGTGFLTAPGPALQYTVTGGTARTITVNSPSTGTPPNAAAWRAAWEKASAPGTLFWCGTSFASIGSNIQCKCTALAGVPTSNNSGPVGTARLWDGRLDFATLVGGAPTAGRTVLKTGVDGELDLSVNAGANFYPLLTTNTGLPLAADPGNRIPGGTAAAGGAIPEIVNICPSGCTYSTLSAACTARAASSTATTPVLFYLGAGVYSTPQTCNNLAFGGIVGAGAGVTIIDASSPQNQSAIALAGSHDLLLANFTVRGRTGINWNNAPGVGVGRSTIRNVEMDPSLETTVATDCLFLIEYSAGSVLRMENNHCVGSYYDGFTIAGTTGLISVESIGNLWDYPLGYGVMGVGSNRRSAWFLLDPIQSFYSYDDTIDETAASNWNTESEGTGMTGFLFASSAQGYSGGVYVIKNPTIRLTNNGDNVLQKRAVGIDVQASTVDVARVDVVGGTIETNVPISTTAGTSQGIELLDSTPVVNLYGTRIRTTGGAAANRFDLVGTTAGNIRVGPDTDFLTADQSTTAILSGQYTRPLLSAPAHCNLGDMYRDVAPTLCLCTSTDTWTCGLAAGGGGGSFSTLGGGTNTAALIVGSGGTLTTSGTGSITATALTCSGCVTASKLGSGFVDAASDLASSLGTDGQILKKVSGAWALAADATGGAPSFDLITSSTNTTAAMIVGTGASITSSGSGSIVATTGDSATAFFSTGRIDAAQLDVNAVMNDIANTFASAGTQSFQDPVTIEPDTTNGVTVDATGLLSKAGTGSVQADDVVCSSCINLAAEVSGTLPASSVGAGLTDAQVSDTLTCSAVTQGSAPSLTTAGQVGVDSTADQWLWYSGGAVQVESATKEVCAIVPDLSANDDSFEFWTPPYAVHATAAGCYCRGTCAAALPTFQFTNRAGTAMTGTPTCATGTTATTFTNLTGSTALVAGDGLRFNVTNSPLGSEGLDAYTICVKYTIDRQ